MQRMKYAGYGIALCAAAMFALLQSDLFPTQFGPVKAKAPAGIALDSAVPPSVAGVTPDTRTHEDTVLTGTSTIPTFPKMIQLSSLAPADGSSVTDIGAQDYQLVGLGVRTVSFLGIQVYVVGLYIAVPDIATLQERLVRLVDPVATTLVPGERQKLKELLLDPEKGEEAWSKILEGGALRTAFRIVPTRSTDFMHLRDGWVRGMTKRTQAATGAGKKDFEDEGFGMSMQNFKGMFSGGTRKSAPKATTVLLTRDGKGSLDMWFEEGEKKGETKPPAEKIGSVQDERISRLIWLGYMAGKEVSSESARRSIVDGIMEFVERPVGTVATQVV